MKFEVSIGEAINKLSILELKMQTCCDENKKIEFQKEINALHECHKHKEEYDMFVEATQNEFVPAFILIESPESEEPSTNLYAPERDFDDLEDGIGIIKEFFER